MAKNAWCKHIFILLSILTAPTLAQTNQFVSPGPAGQAGDYQTGLNFVLGQPQVFSWTTTSYAVDLNLIQERNNIIANGVQWAISTNNTKGSYTWNGTLGPGQNLVNGRVFFLQIFDYETIAVLATSTYFNISSGVGTSSAVSSSASLSSSTPAASNTPTSTTSASTATTPTNSSPTGSNSSSATATASAAPTNDASLAVGLGVGLGCAVLFILVGAAYAIYRSRKKRNGQANLAPGPPQEPYYAAPPPHPAEPQQNYSYASPPHQYASQSPPAMLSSDVKYEAPAGQQDYKELP